jgi:hypothetical protein
MEEKVSPLLKGQLPDMNNDTTRQTLTLMEEIQAVGDLITREILFEFPPSSSMDKRRLAT